MINGEQHNRDERKLYEKGRTKLRKRKKQMERIERVKSVLEREGISYEETTVLKNGIDEHALIIGDSSCRITIYKNTFSENVPDDVILKAINDAKKRLPSQEQIDKWSSWDYVRDNTRLVLRPRCTNDDERVLKRIINDELEIVYKVFVSAGTIPVTPDILKRFEVSENELYLAALINVKGSVATKPLKDLMDIPTTIPMIVLSNKELYYGAAAIFASDMLENLCNDLEDDLYILPSSIHECLVVPASSVTYETLTCMVKEVNETQVPDDEILCSHPFFYERASREITWMPKSA